MVGMAAAFDALITAEEDEASSRLTSPAVQSPTAAKGQKVSAGRSAEDLLADLQVKYEQLEREHEELKLKYRLLEAKIGQENKEEAAPHTMASGGTASKPVTAPTDIMQLLSSTKSEAGIRRKVSSPASSSSGASPVSAQRSASANSLSQLTPLREKEAGSGSADSVKEEVSRVRREIKQQLMLPIKEGGGGAKSDTASQDLASSSKGADWLEDSVAVEKFERNWLTSQNVYSFGDWRFSRAPGRTLVVEAEGFNVESGDVALEALSPSNQ